MITEQRVERLFAEANPAPMTLEVEEPDVAAYLADLEGRSSEMTDTKTKTTEDAGRPRGWLVAAIAGTVVLTGGILFGLNRGESAAPPEVEAALAAIEAFNEGDIEAWNAAWDPSALADAGWEYDGVTHSMSEIFIHANQQVTVVEPCAVVEPNRVECGIAIADDFHGPAGISGGTGVAIFHLTHDQLIMSYEEQTDCCATQGAYTFQFNVWLSSAYPNVWADIRPPDFESLPGWRRDPADMAVAIQYVEEFVAQSSIYPLEQNGS